MRELVEFESEGATLRGWIDLPDGLGPYPAVVATGGYNGVKEFLLYHPYPEVFRAAGIAVLVYDHINCGESDGEPRNELDPFKQQRGYRDAISYLWNRADIDETRIGIWGTSYAGGHVLEVAATDRRVKAVVSQAMTISGHGNSLRRNSPAGYVDLHRRIALDRAARARGEAPEYVQAFGDESDTMKHQNATPPEFKERWVNRTTLRSLEFYDYYEPAAFIERIAPTPLLMIVPTGDTMTPAEDALSAYNRALEPKEILLVPGEHYAVYEEHFEVTSTRARDFFVRCLRP
ncbi:MAG: alpha/beta hydrolase [Acidimicrobiia bacterium]